MTGCPTTRVPIRWGRLFRRWPGRCCRRSPRDHRRRGHVIDTPVTSVVGTEQSNNGVTVAPTLELVNGVIQGALNATSERGLPMTYTFVGSSAGGKVDIGNVPVTPSLSDPQSYTILPYANWLDSGVKGSEQFSVRVSEVTDFGAASSPASPLVGGLLFEPIIGLLQELPLISTLLAPIIGGSIVAAIDVAVNTLAPPTRRSRSPTRSLRSTVSRSAPTSSRQAAWSRARTHRQRSIVRDWVVPVAPLRPDQLPVVPAQRERYPQCRLQPHHLGSAR